MRIILSKALWTISNELWKGSNVHTLDSVTQALRANNQWYANVYLALCDPGVTRSWNRCCALLETDRRAHVHALCAGHALFMATERDDDNKVKTKQQKWHLCDNAEFLKVKETEYWSLRQEL